MLIKHDLDVGAACSAFELSSIHAELDSNLQSPLAVGDTCDPKKPLVKLIGYLGAFEF